MDSFSSFRTSMSGMAGKMDQLRRRFSQTEMQGDDGGDQLPSSSSTSPNPPQNPPGASPGYTAASAAGASGSGYASSQSQSQQYQLPSGVRTDRPNMNLNFNNPPSMPPGAGAQSGVAGPPPGPPPSQMTAGQQRALPKTISAPSSPTRTSAPATATAANIARSIFRQVSQSTTNLVEKTVAGVAGATGRDRAKILLVIDDQNTDWSKYFRGRRIQNEWEIRVEQAEFSEISTSAHNDRGAVVNIESFRGTTKQARSFRPDFLLIRQPIRDVDRDYRQLVLALMYGNVPSVNSMESLNMFLDRPLIFAYLNQLQTRLGRDKFPVISQSFYSKYHEMLVPQMFPVVVKIGHSHGGLGKIRVDNAADFQDVVGLVGSCGAYCTVEPFIDSKYDLHLQKIGPSYKAFVRKSINASWKTNVGSSMLEQIPLQEKHKMWLEECSRLCGGLDFFAIEAVVAKDGQENIISLNDCTTMGLLGEAQEDDRQMIAEIVFRKMDADENRRRYSQTATMPPPSQQQDGRQAGAAGPVPAGVPNGHVPQTSPMRRESRDSVTGREQPGAGLPGQRPGMPDRPGPSGMQPSFGGPPSRDPPMRDPRDSNIREYSNSPMGRDSSMGPVSGTPPGMPTRRDDPAGGPPARPPQPPALEKRLSQSNMAAGMAAGGPPGMPGRGPMGGMPMGGAAGPAGGPMGRFPPNPEVDDTMSNLKKTFAGIFGDM